MIAWIALVLALLALGLIGLAVAVGVIAWRKARPLVAMFAPAPASPGSPPREPGPPDGQRSTRLG